MLQDIKVSRNKEMGNLVASWKETAIVVLISKLSTWSSLLSLPFTVLSHFSN